jgi:putative CocE/NonD family hydrolase
VHGVPSRTRTSYGGLEVGPNAVVDYTEIQLRFFDYWMKGIDNGYSSEPPVRIFVMGDNVWRSENEWPLARTRYTDVFLDAGEKLSNSAPSSPSTAKFVYDPRKPASIPPNDTATGVTSQVLAYTSPAFDRPTEITGQILLKLWVASTAVDTDITARLYEVNAVGELRRLTVAPGVLRARYRSTEEPQPPKPLAPNQPTELTINLGYTSYVIPAGHKLRLFVTGSLSPNVHLNVYAPFVSMDQAVTATQTVQHTSRYPSRIVLPVIPR